VIDKPFNVAAIEWEPLLHFKPDSRVTPMDLTANRDKP